MYLKQEIKNNTIDYEAHYEKYDENSYEAVFISEKSYTKISMDKNSFDKKYFDIIEVGENKLKIAYNPSKSVSTDTVDLNKISLIIDDYKNIITVNEGSGITYTLERERDYPKVIEESIPYISNQQFLSLDSGLTFDLKIPYIDNLADNYLSEHYDIKFVFFENQTILYVLIGYNDELCIYENNYYKCKEVCIYKHHSNKYLASYQSLEDGVYYYPPFMSYYQTYQVNIIPENAIKENIYDKMNHTYNILRGINNSSIYSLTLINAILLLLILI